MTPRGLPPGLKRGALLVALVGIFLLVLGVLVDPARFWRAYFTGVMVAFQLPLGCLGLLIAWHIMGGRWGRVIADALEAGVWTLPLLALLFLPLLLNLDVVYRWARPEYVAPHEVVAHKTAYLNPAFFTARSLAYLAIWLGLAAALTIGRRAHGVPARRPRIAMLGAVLYALTVSFASIDWLMSLEPRFNSTVYPMLIMSAQAVGALALVVLVTLRIAEVEHRVHLLRQEGLVGLGALLLGLVMLWAYIAFMQLLVIWSGDLPHNAEWYVVRTQGIWLWLLWIVALGHVAVPFLALLPTRARQSWALVLVLSGLILVMRLLDGLWLILPAFGAEMPPAWLVLGALMAVVGIWSAAFLWLIARREARVGHAIEAAVDG